MVTNEYRSVFEFRDSDKPKQKRYSVCNPFKEDTQYFEHSGKEFMNNNRVENIGKLVDELKNTGVTICNKIETYEYIKFVRILDPENNKIELWEPIDQSFTDMNEGKTTK